MQISTKECVHWNCWISFSPNHKSVKRSALKNMKNCTSDICCGCSMTILNWMIRLNFSLLAHNNNSWKLKVDITSICVVTQTIIPFLLQRISVHGLTQGYPCLSTRQRSVVHHFIYFYNILRIWKYLSQKSTKTLTHLYLADLTTATVYYTACVTAHGTLATTCIECLRATDF